jgi:hypothetical protein
MIELRATETDDESRCQHQPRAPLTLPKEAE